jgi:hypothetical protein
MCRIARNLVQLSASQGLKESEQAEIAWQRTERTMQLRAILISTNSDSKMRLVCCLETVVDCRTCLRLSTKTWNDPNPDFYFLTSISIQDMVSGD